MLVFCFCVLLLELVEARSLDGEVLLPGGAPVERAGHRLLHVLILLFQLCPPCIRAGEAIRERRASLALRCELKPQLREDRVHG